MTTYEITIELMDETIEEYALVKLDNNYYPTYSYGESVLVVYPTPNANPQHHYPLANIRRLIINQHENP